LQLHCCVWSSCWKLGMQQAESWDSLLTVACCLAWSINLSGRIGADSPREQPPGTV
jgi:hypothetical protein